MENANISELASILREHGDKILNFESKFTLSEFLLNKLNNSFLLLNDQKDISSSFHVISSSSRTDYLRDIQFLHDFCQKTASLKIVVDETDTTTDNLDISIFKNLKLFEIYKININKIKGIQSLRAQIQYLVCRWTLVTLNEIFEKCGCDQSQGFVWSELKEASFSHNNLCDLDTSLEFVPWLHTLDLSHNQIRDARPLNCLSSLKYLNLSYNNLESVPAFSGQICTRLQVLTLNNNFIENIGSLINLVNLYELNLSDNCLIDHKSLVPLTCLAALQWLSLEGNPLSFHPQHRIKVLSYLHINTATVKFLLDHKVMTKVETKMVGKIQPIYHRQHLESLSSSVSNSTLVAADRPRRVRTAMIADGNENSEMDTSMASANSLVTSSDHLETKRQIERLREQYGESWLHSQAGSLVQDALGLEKSLPISSSPYGDILSSLEASMQQTSGNKENAEVKSNLSVNGTETYTTASETTGVEDGPYAGSSKNPSQASMSDDEDILGEGEESLFLVTPKGQSEPVFLVVTKNLISERDCNTGKEKTRWPMDTLLACSVDQNTISLEFDTVKRDKQKREYQLDGPDAEKLLKVLKELLSLAQKSRVIIFKCMKCGTQFGQEKNRQMQKKTSRVCPIPTCQSTLVIEDDEQQQ